ncbi:hypothetical protein HDU76_007070, partial [Blyttiomyces sp. JEL0837]
MAASVVTMPEIKSRSSSTAPPGSGANMILPPVQKANMSKTPSSVGHDQVPPLPTTASVTPKPPTTTSNKNQTIPRRPLFDADPYDPSKDPALVRRRPILRPLVELRAFEFHRNWPLEILSQRLQIEREREIAHLRRLFLLRIQNPYVTTTDLKYYKMTAALGLDLSEEAEAEPLPRAPSTIYYPSTAPHGHSHGMAERLTTMDEEGNPQDRSHTSHTFASYLHPRHNRVNLPGGPKDPTAVFKRLTDTPNMCKHRAELKESDAIAEANHNPFGTHPAPPPPSFYNRISAPKQRYRDLKEEESLEKRRGPPAKKIDEEYIRKLSMPRLPPPQP